MKFGKHLQKERESDWAVHYIDYNELKKLIMRIGEEKAGALKPACSGERDARHSRADPLALRIRIPWTSMHSGVV